VPRRNKTTTDDNRTVEELRARVAELDAEYPGENFPANARDEWNDLNERIDELETRRARIEELAKNPANRDEPATYYPSRGNMPAAPGPFGQRVDEARTGALRAIETHVNTGVLTTEAADNADDLVRRDRLGLDAEYITAVADEHYRSAFMKVIMDPVHGHLRHTPQEVAAFQRVNAAEAQRSMVIGTGSAGGFGVPFTLDPTILLTSSGALNPIRQISTVFTVNTDTWKGVSSQGVTTTYQAEAAAVTDGTPTLAQPVIDCAMWRCFVPYSIEIGQDWGSLEAELARIIADARDVTDATQFLTGTGTDSPAGVLTGLTTSQRVQDAGAGFPAVADHYALKAAVPARFLPNLTWAAHQGQWDRTYRLTPAGSTTEPQMLPTREGQMLGRPKVEWSTMSNVSTAGQKLIIAGDFKSAFYIADRVGMTVELIPHLFGAAQGNLPTGQRGLFAYGRTGSKVVIPEALRYLETV
jgi:HK97 family phage major capsid protein